MLKKRKKSFSSITIRVSRWQYKNVNGGDGLLNVEVGLDPGVGVGAESSTQQLYMTAITTYTYTTYTSIIRRHDLLSRIEILVGRSSHRLLTVSACSSALGRLVRRRLGARSGARRQCLGESQRCRRRRRSDSVQLSRASAAPQWLVVRPLLATRCRVSPAVRPAGVRHTPASHRVATGVLSASRPASHLCESSLESSPQASESREPSSSESQ